MNIICGTDFSEGAGRAADVAAALAARLHDRLELIHALSGGAPGAAPAAATGSATAQPGDRLATEAARLRRFGAEIEQHLVPGRPERVIPSQVAPGETRLIVVGATAGFAAGHRQAEGVGERVAEAALVPTLVVRQDEPFVRWADGERALRVVCAYDFTPTADAALEWLNELRRWGRCEIVVAQVDSPPEEKARLGLPGPARLDGNEDEVQTILERDLTEHMHAVLDDAGARIRVKGAWGRPDVDLIGIANLEQADVIVTGAHQRHGVGRLLHMSVSRALLRHAPMSVLVVPLTKAPKPLIRGTPQRVLAATDFSEAGDQAVQRAYALCGAGGQVRLVHVVHPHVLAPGAAGPGPGDPHATVHPSERARLSADRLRALVPAEAAGRGITTEVEVVEHPRPALAIAQAAERFGADIICLGTRGRSRLSVALGDSVTQNLLRLTTRPLLVARWSPERASSSGE